MFPRNKKNLELARRIFLDSLDECLYFPKYFEIETINACNARCIMCTINDWSKKNNSVIKDELFEKFINEVANYSDWIETICLNRDGEPTLDKQLSKRVKMLKKAGIKRLTLTTNAQLLTPELSSELIDSGLDDIMISMDSIKKETFEKIRVGLNYETVVGNILALIKIRNEKESKMTIRIRMVIIDENKEEVEEWIQYWTGFVSEKDRVYAMPAHTWGNQLKQDKSATYQAIQNNPCVFVFSSIAMHVNGEIGLCNVDYNIKHAMGDFTKQSIKEIWNGPEFNRVRELHAAGRKNNISLCKGCNIWDREYK
ncbi:MAG: radical SAM/SPASM domain-containing protein, partial [Bacillota bacterium]